MTTVLIAWVLACTPPETEGDPPVTPTGPTDTVSETGTVNHTGLPTPTGETAATGTTADTGTAFDCTTVPAGLRPMLPLDGLFPSEDFAFDDDGHLISATGTELVKQDYPPGTITAFVSTGTDPSSLRMLPTGDLVYANIDSQSLFRVQMDGVREVVTSGFGYATGIDVNPSGTVFIGDAGLVKRIDPYTGSVEVIFDNNGLFFGIINGLTFSDDWSTLYLGTYGSIYALPVDAAGTPTGPPTEVYVASQPGEFLGMGFDSCGNLYALQSGRLLRFNDVANWPGGEPEVLMDGGLTTTNLQWGRGLGGWDALKIYVVDRNAARPPFYEVDVGVPSKTYW